MIPFSEITGDWSDRPVYVVGGGTSLEGFDFARIRGMGYMIGANKFAWLSGCNTLFSLDQHFMRMHRDDIQSFVKDGGEAILAVPPNEDGHKIIDGATYVVRRRNGGLSCDPSSVYGVNSGYGALGVAFLKNAKEIALLGFDFQYGRDGKTHWHGRYPWHSHNGHRFMNRWATNFEKAKEQLDAAGSEVTNFVGPVGSKVEAFRKAPLGDL